MSLEVISATAYLRREQVFRLAVGGIQENCIGAYEPLHMLIFQEVRPKSHVAAVDVLATVWQLEEELHSPCICPV